MFGSRLKTWMENYIGLPRKKDPQKDKSKRNDGGGGIIVESSESLACSDTGISFSSQQVLSSSTTDNKEGYSTTTMESERSGMTHCHTAVSLPSPESAYSTGYSTDGASPGETGPPEYYINIRTGKHYFPSPAPTPTSPQPNVNFLQLHTADRRPSTSYPSKDPPLNLARLPPTDGQPSFSETFPAKSRLHTFTTFSNGFPPRLDTSAVELRNCQARKTLSASAPNYFENFSKSPCKKSSPISQLTPIKLFLKSPRHEKEKPKTEKAQHNKKPKKWFKQPFQKFGHRRTDSCDEAIVRTEPKKSEIQPEKNFRYILGQENSASPRQRNRIKTNPWLPTEPMSSQNFHFTPSVTWNRSCSNTPLQNRKLDPTPVLQLNVRNEDTRMKKPETGASRKLEMSDHSEEDLTLNEVMGTYNESYVYEKETDILSDSDPTDCEDYETDSEADNGGDERDSHDDELDFIDNGSLYECEDDFPQNTGRCTYHDVHIKKNSFVHKGDRRKFRKDSECRKNSRKEQGVRRDKRRQTRKSLKDDDEDRRKVLEEKVKAKMEETGRGSNLSRVLAQRLLAKKASKSAEGTPVTVRRQKLTTELRETHIGSEKGTPGEGRQTGDVVLIDFEADLKYNELMKEAQHMFESLRNSPVIKNRKQIHVVEQRTPDIPKKMAQQPARKSPKELDLKLSVDTPKKLKRLDFDRTDRSSFKTRTSAHSPLDPLGPTLRNFAVFSPVRQDDRKASSSSSEESEPRKRSPVTGDRWGALPTSPVVPIAFQSVDLGKAPAPYCPQSEPVKRKIYSCSKTYDKLVKRFENKPTVFEETINGSASLGTKDRDWTVSPNLDRCLDGNQGVFPRERRRDGEKAPPRGGGILRRPGRCCAGEVPPRRPLNSDIPR